MVEDKFKIELLPGGDERAHYNGGRFSSSWPTGIRLTLDGKIVGLRNQDGGESDYHFPIVEDAWEPGHMLGNGLNILDRKPVYFGIGRSRFQLAIKPRESDDVEISLNVGKGHLERLSAAANFVQPVVVPRELAALEFFKFFNAVVRDVVRYNDAGAFRQIRRDYAESLTQPPIKDLLDKYKIVVAQVPKEFLED